MLMNDFTTIFLAILHSHLLPICLFTLVSTIYLHNDHLSQRIRLTAGSRQKVARGQHNRKHHAGNMRRGRMGNRAPLSMGMPWDCMIADPDFIIGKLPRAMIPSRRPGMIAGFSRDLPVSWYCGRTSVVDGYV